LNYRNEVVFNRSANSNFLQVIQRVASLIYLWSYLLPVEQREPLATGCNRLMAVVRAIFNQGGWLQSRRIEDAPYILHSLLFFPLADIRSDVDRPIIVIMLYYILWLLV
jgi:two-component response regulator (ARR-B family)